MQQSVQFIKNKYRDITKNNRLKADLDFLDQVLDDFTPLITFYAPWKHQQTKGFLMFSGAIEGEQWHQMG